MICFRNNAYYSGCTLKVDDFTMYPDGIGTVEFVAHIKDGVFTALNNSIRITICPNKDDSYSYTPEIDGRYIYYKIALPVFNSLDTDCQTVEIPIGYFIGTIGCDKIICFNENNSVSLSDSGAGVNFPKVENMMSLLESGLLTDFFAEEFFSICNLNKCVSKVQKKYILEHADDCGSMRCRKGSDSDKANRDFLFIASYLLDHYIQLRDFDQAEELLNTIQTCGSSLCGENANLNCGCNG